MVTIFSKITEVENPFYKEINDVLFSFKDGSNKSKIDAIRLIKDKKDRNIEKAKLKSICFVVGSNGTIGVGKLHLRHLLWSGSLRNLHNVLLWQ